MQDLVLKSRYSKVGFDYDASDNRTQATYGNDANIVYRYDIADKLTRITNNMDACSIDIAYSNYDKVGNRRSMKVNDANTQAYQYDNLYQLIYVDYNNGNTTNYYYDPLGNRTKVTNGSEISYQSNQLNQYTTIGGTSYSYDVNGNLTYDGVYTYIYDCENRLIEVKQGTTTIATYAYDYAGRRVSKTQYAIRNTQYAILYL